MSRNYLLKVIGLSTLPRCITFVFTLISLPLMVRALGAQQYGVIVYLQSICGLLELFVGLGVPAAAGRALAAARAANVSYRGAIVARWARLQMMSAVITLAPVTAVFFLTAFPPSSVPMPKAAICFMIGALYAGVGGALVRSVLQAELSFHALAVIDSVESIVRSCAWLIIAFVLPTVLGLAIATFAASFSSLSVGGVLTLRAVRRTKAGVLTEPQDGIAQGCLAMLRESFGFLILVTATRAYQTIPNIIIGRVLGFEVNGILGAFTKVVEIAALPFTIVGNALMVRAQEVKRLGMVGVRRYWDIVAHVAVPAFACASAICLGAVLIANSLLPSEARAGSVFTILTPIIALRSLSDLVAPASDYVGGLRNRVIFLSAAAVLQAPAVWLAATTGGVKLTACVLVISYAAIVIGYVFIALRVFFGSVRYTPPREAFVALFVIFVSFIISSIATQQPLARLALFGLCGLIGFVMIPRVRYVYLTGRFIQFDIV